MSYELSVCRLVALLWAGRVGILSRLFDGTYRGNMTG